MGGVLGFLAVLLGIIAGIHGYLYKRLVRDTTEPGRARRVGTVLVTLLALLVPLTLVLARRIDRDVVRWLAWPGYVWLALMFYLLIALLVLELPRLLGARLLARRTATDAPGAASARPATRAAERAAERAANRPATRTAEHSISRRLVLARTTAAIAGTAAVGLVGYGMTSALGQPRINRVTVPLRRLGAELDGLRIAVVSDIHIGPILGRRHTERVVSVINEARPDLVAIVGDLVDGTVAELGEDAAPLADLVSAHGSFFVTGNHEYFSGVGPWVAELERLGVRPLLNERTEIRAGAAVLDLAGVNDLTGIEDGDGPDYDRALGGRDTTRPVVLLAHQPVQVHEAAAHGVDLQLSGHTHGGQLYPFHYLVRLQQPVLSGLSRFNETQLYVTRGAGFWGPPVRVGAPPEVVIMQLVRG